MRALVKKQKTAGLWMEDVPIPQVGPDEVLIKTRKNSICGTDIHIYQWDDWAQRTIKVPMIIGHEFMGEIAELGKNVNALPIGSRVCAEGHLTCGKCSLCRIGKKHLCLHTKGLGVNRSGSFAEYFTIPAENLFLIPDSISDQIASIFDPYGNAVHTALSFNLIGEDVLITGAGPIGIMAVAIAKKAGARHIVVTDINDYRLHLAKKMGATETLNISKNSIQNIMKSLNIEDGFTIGLEMSGHPQALEMLLETMRNGAHVALLGILPAHTEINWDLVIFKMLTIKGIYGREIFETWYKMVHLLESGLDLTPIITHEFPIQEYEKGFEIMLSGQCGKVILNW
jgi:threonine 3-dehydrogenase